MIRGLNHFKYVDEKPRVSSTPYTYDIAEGNVTNHSSWFKIGYNPDIGTSEEDLWAVGGTYTWPTSAMQMEVISSSVEDDPSKADTSPGTGIWSVIIYYLDGDGTARTETVNLNGTAAVATTATNIYRIQGFRAVTTGTGLKAAGNIDLRHLDDTPIYGRIATGYTRARNNSYTVPTGKTLYVVGGWLSVHSATKGVRFIMRSTYDEGVASVRTFFLPFGEVSMANGFAPFEFVMPRKFPAGTRIMVSGIADAAGAISTCQLEGWLE